MTGWRRGPGKPRGRSGRFGSAPRPREAILPPGPSKALHVHNPRQSSLPHLGPSGGRCPLPAGAGGRGRQGREGRVRGPPPPGRACRGDPGSRGGTAGAGADAALGPERRREPDRGARRERKKGEGGEPLPILGRSRRRRRPAVGESKVVAGRHFGIFPQPAGHCGGHGESGPMAGGQS